MKQPLICIAALSLTGTALGQAGNNVRLDLRIVPQVGTLPGTLTDLPSSTHVPITSLSDNVRRFEVQYRLIVPAGGDGYTPAGLASGHLRIVLTGDTTASRLEPAILSRFESQVAGSQPPTTPDTSGGSTGPLAAPNEARGLHRPFRGGIPDPAPNNSAPANGTVAADGKSISGITPLTMLQTNQNAPGGPDGLGAYYGLYSFNFVASNMPGPLHISTLTASFDADAVTGDRFSFFDDGNLVPVTTRNATSGTAAIPAFPTPGSLAIIGVGGLLTTMRRRR